MNDGQGARAGATPQQIRTLQSPIAHAACSIHPYHKWVYVSGAVINLHLNRIFGFDGWSFEILSLDFIAPDMGNPVKKRVDTGRDGKPKEMYVVEAMCRARLHLHWPGGRTTFHDGVGVSGVPQPNAADACDMNAASATTYAMRNAAIHLGPQFGLEVMRLKVTDDNGRPIPWVAFTGPEPEWPDFLGDGGGVGRGETDYRAVADNFDAVDQPETLAQPAARESAPRREPQREAARAAQPAQAQQDAPVQATQPAQDRQQQGEATERVAVQGHGAESPPLADLPSDYSRDGYTTRCRAAWGLLHQRQKGRPDQVLRLRCEAWGVNIPAPKLKATEAAGGPSDIFLADVTLAIEAEAKGGA